MTYVGEHQYDPYDDKNPGEFPTLEEWRAMARRIEREEKVMHSSSAAEAAAAPMLVDREAGYVVVRRRDVQAALDVIAFDDLSQISPEAEDRLRSAVSEDAT